MLWVFLIVILIIAGFAMPRFGIALLILVGVIVGAVVLLLFNNQQEAQASKTRISVNELDLSELRLAPQQHSDNSFYLVGRIRNKSARYTLSTMRLKLTMKDCVAANQCETVGESSESIYESVPPGQSREISEYVSFSGLGKARGKFDWSYVVEEITGK